MNELLLAIYESERVGTINANTRERLVGVLQESTLSPLKDYINKIELIKKQKPSEYDGPESVKKFVDTFYNDIISCAAILEKEPEKVKRYDIILAVSMLGSLITGAILTGIASTGVGVFVAGIPGFILLTFGYIILPLVYLIRRHIRLTHDTKVSEELSKIKTSLKRINMSKLNDAYKKKISDIISAIDDTDPEPINGTKVHNIVTQANYGNYGMGFAGL